MLPPRHRVIALRLECVEQAPEAYEMMMSPVEQNAHTRHARIARRANRSQRLHSDLQKKT
jgi:hypothetical protein